MTEIIADRNTIEDISSSAPPPPPTSATLPGTGIANLPNQRHKIVAKNGANFTIMVCGTDTNLNQTYFQDTSR